MYVKLRYNALHQRAQSSSCETFASQLIIYRLEDTAGAPPASAVVLAWETKRNDYPQHHTAHLVLDYVLRSCLLPQRGYTLPSLSHLSVRDQCNFLEIQRLCSIVHAHFANASAATTANDPAEARATTVVAALNLGAGLDVFLWKHANQRPINVF